MDARSAGPRWTHLLLGTDAAQRLRVSMTGVAALLMGICMLLMNSMAWAGLTARAPVQWWSLLCTLGLVAAYVAIRSGWSRRCADPSLTLPQMLYAIACNAVAYAIAGPARGFTLAILAVILMFGIFGLSTRQMLGVLVYALIMFGAALGFVAWHPEPGHEPVLEIAHATMIVVVLLSGTFLTTRVQATRLHLQRQKHELTRALEQISRLATRDALTGLVNRRHMLELLQREFARAARQPRHIVLAQLDIDHFKAINDQHGHAAGDKALQTFADVVSASVRQTDVLARWGGEEFVLLLCDTPLGEAQQLLERVRTAVAQATPHGAGGAEDTGNTGDGVRVPFTVSIGAAVHTPGEAAERTLERADRALYAAKAAGRNRVVLCPGSAAESATTVAPPPA